MRKIFITSPKSMYTTGHRTTKVAGVLSVIRTLNPDELTLPHHPQVYTRSPH